MDRTGITNATQAFMPVIEVPCKGCGVPLRAVKCWFMGKGPFCGDCSRAISTWSEAGGDRDVGRGSARAKADETVLVVAPDETRVL